MKKCISVFVAGLAILISVSICTATEDHHGDSHICFKRIDSNHDDTVTQEELSKFFSKDPELFKKMDLDRDGKISHDEYEEYWYSQE